MKTVALICPDGHSVLLFCKGIIAALREAGWDRVLVITDAGSYRGEIEALGVDCADVPISRFTDLAADLRYIASLRRILARERCEAVLNFSTKPNIFGAMAAKLAGCRTIVSHVVGLGATFLPDPALSARMMRSIMRLLYRLSSHFSSRVWFTNPTDRAYFVDSGLVAERKTMLTRNYLDTLYYSASMEDERDVDALRRELSLDRGRTVVLMVARLIWPKGIREFAGAAELLRARRPECHFLLVAPPEPPSSQTVPVATVKSYEAEGNFTWLGFRRDVRRLYALCDIAVLPTYYKEGGYPRALLEPMSMGKPLVASTSDDCRGTVDEGRNGFLVPPRDAHALADAIEKLAADPDLRREFGRNSRAKAVAEFDERIILHDAIREAGLLPKA
jgi:N,N'-diacetylbacillosaminyl-diphospho-undecaprenol alpha-1,3-N-acetylgalactosaminyltransferase